MKPANEDPAIINVIIDAPATNTDLTTPMPPGREGT